MKMRLFTVVIAVSCVLLMIGITFQPVAATRGPQGMTAFPDTIIDEDGNRHMVYSQMVRKDIDSWQFDIFYKNDIEIEQSWFGHHWNTPIQISSSDTDSVQPQITIDEVTGITYVAWIEKEWRSNEFWYAGSTDYFTFTQERYGSQAPWPTAPNLEMNADVGFLDFTWKPTEFLSLVADIDADLINDINDDEPTVYNIDNPEIEMDIDVIATESDTGVTVAVDYADEENEIPTIEVADGDFVVSTGDYIDIILETTENFNAIIKMPISEDIPPALNNENLRMYRQVGDDWVVVTDWENEEFTGINEEDGYVWAYVEHFSVYTTADASSWDGDSDGLTDLTEDTEPVDYDPFINLNSDNFQPNKELNILDETPELRIEVNEYNNIMAFRGFIEVTLDSSEPLYDLQLDIGDDGTVDWMATTPLTDSIRIGSIKEAINDYMFQYLNSNDSWIYIPFKFSASNYGEITISQAVILFEDVTTYNYLSDTSSDDLYDGWQDKNGNFIYERAGADGILGTADDEIPGARWHNKDPRNKNIIGSKGNVPWNEFQNGINQVNGNLAVISTDLSFKAMGFQIELTRTYNSLNANLNGPFGYGWQFSYGERLEFKLPFIYFVSSDGAYYEFESLADGNFASPAGVNMDLINMGGVYKLRYTDGSVKTFDDTGLLRNIRDKSGNTLMMVYNMYNQLSNIVDDSGLIMHLDYVDGRVSQITDPLGRINTYTYDSYGNLKARFDAMGNKYTYNYGVMSFTGVHLMMNQINPLGLWKQYSYTTDNTPKVYKVNVGEYDFGTGTSSNVFTEYEANYAYPGHTETMDANSQPTVRVFDKGGVVTKEINADGTTVSKIYDNNRNIIEKIDARGYVWRNKYDAIGNQIENGDPMGNATKTEFRITDTVDKYISLPEKTIDKNTEETLYQYDADDNLADVTNSEGEITSFTYTQDGLLGTQTAPNTGVTAYEYDAYGNVIRKIDPMGYERLSSCDSVNRMIESINARGFTTTYVYDELDRMVEKIDPLGNSETYTYDAVGNLLSATDIAGYTTVYTYDVMNRKTSETDALGNTSYFNYDNAGNIVESIDKRGFSTIFYYDDMNRIIQIEDALGFSEYYAYNEAGNRIQKIDKLGNYWNSSYDGLGMLIEEYCPYDEAILYEYDATGHLIKQTDRMGYETIFEYDSLGNQIRVLGAEGSDTRYGYDSVSNLITVSQVDGATMSTWEYDYDLLGRKTLEYTPLGFEYNWVYDEVGNVIEYMDAKGTVTEYQYDALNRITNLTMPGIGGLQAPYKVNITYIVTESERENYDYPPIMVLYGLPTNMKPLPPALMALEKEYDELGRIVREMWAVNDIDGFQFGDTEYYNITYEYDANGNVIEMTDQFGLITTYNYDAMDRLETLTDPDGDTTSYIYDPLGQLVLTTYPTETMIYQEYNKANLLTGIYNIGSDDTIISSFEYTYNFNANRMSVTEADGYTTNYSYDMENRLTSVTYPNSDQTLYQYDNRNNMISTTQVIGGVSNTTDNFYDIENRMIQSSDQIYEYDNNGNLIQGETSYGYYSTYLDGYKVNWLASVGTTGGINPNPNVMDGGPTLLSSTVETTETTPATTYGFALDGRRVGKSGEADMLYLYDGENVIYELWEYKTVRFTHPIHSDSCSGGCGDGNCALFFTDHPISISVDGVKYYYLYDGLGSVTELIDESENVVNIYRYTPFGDVLVKIETVYNPHQFTGRQYDEESGLYHYRARAYSADIGRFMQQDPAGMVDGPNVYVYTKNNPINIVDPSGLGWWCNVKCAILFALASTAIGGIVGGFAAATGNSPMGLAITFAVTAIIGSVGSIYCLHRCKGSTESALLAIVVSPAIAVACSVTWMLWPPAGLACTLATGILLIVAAAIL